jgi:hypothetical protein
MRVLGTQFNKQGGPDATGSFKLEFSVDESQSKAFYKFVGDLKKGTSLILMAFENEQEIEEITTETPAETRTRFNKRFHVLINSTAKETGKEKKEIKKIIKKYLIKKNYMKESTSELDLKGLAAGIYFLQQEFENNLDEFED